MIFSPSVENSILSRYRPTPSFCPVLPALTAANRESKISGRYTSGEVVAGDVDGVDFSNRSRRVRGPRVPAENAEVVFLFRGLRLRREFSAALCLGGGAVKRDVRRERWRQGSEEGSEPRRQIGRKRERRRKKVARKRGRVRKREGRGSRALTRGRGEGRSGVKRGEFMGRRATGRSDIPTWHGEINITL